MTASSAPVQSNISTGALTAVVKLQMCADDMAITDIQSEWHSSWASPEAAVKPRLRISHGIVRPCTKIEKATTANADTMSA
jgi:hypothetical protein